MQNKIKRKYYNGVHYILDEKSQVVKLLPEFHKALLDKKLPFNRGFKKLGGSSLCNVIETDKYKSKFAAFCHLANLSLPMLINKYVIAGDIFEYKMFEKMQKNYQGIEHLIAKDLNYDYFNNKYYYFQGVPDGIIPKAKTVLEMKTAGIINKESWGPNGTASETVPLGYRRQAQIYAYLLDYSRYSIVATFLENQDYINPESKPLKLENVRQYLYKVNVEEAQEDLKKCKNFFDLYSQTGISPTYDLSKLEDIKLVKYLQCHNDQEWIDLLNEWKRLKQADLDIEP